MTYADYYAALQEEVARFNRKCHWRFTPTIRRNGVKYFIGAVEIESGYLWYRCLSFTPSRPPQRIEIRGLPDEEWTRVLSSVWEPRNVFFSQPKIALMSH